MHTEHAPEDTDQAECPHPRQPGVQTNTALLPVLVDMESPIPGAAPPGIPPPDPAKKSSDGRARPRAYKTQRCWALAGRRECQEGRRWH